EAKRLAELLVQKRDESCPQGRDGAGSTDDLILSIDANLIAGLRIGVSGNIGHTSALESGIDLRGYAGVLLVIGNGEEVADAAAGCALVIRELVPDLLERNLRTRG